VDAAGRAGEVTLAARRWGRGPSRRSESLMIARPAAQPGRVGPGHGRVAAGPGFKLATGCTRATGRGCPAIDSDFEPAGPGRWLSSEAAVTAAEPYRRPAAGSPAGVPAGA
jgi:hypothetical protein